MSDPSSQPTQPLTDEELARTMLARRRGAVQSLNGCDCMQPDSHGIVLDSLGDIPRLLAEVSRLRAENTALRASLDQFNSFPDNPGPGNWSPSYRMGYADAGRDVRAIVRALGLDQDGSGNA